MSEPTPFEAITSDTRDELLQDVFAVAAAFAKHLDYATRELGHGKLRVSVQSDIDNVWRHYIQQVIGEERSSDY